MKTQILIAMNRAIYLEEVEKMTQDKARSQAADECVHRLCPPASVALSCLWAGADN